VRQDWRVLALTLFIVLCATAGCAGKQASVQTTDDTASGLTPVLTHESFPPVSMPTETPTRQAQPTWTPAPTDLAQTPTIAPTQTPVPTQTPTRDPRHRMVAFVSDWAGDDDVYLLSLETGEWINLTRPAGSEAGGADVGRAFATEERDPAFAPDGRTLTFRSDAGGSWAFYEIDLVTGARTLVGGGAEMSSAYQGGLSWNQMGESGVYAYESYRDGNLDLYVRTEAGIHQPLVQHPAGDYGPAWRPGMAQIAFASWRDGKKDVYLVDADGSHLTRLTDGPGEYEEPSWHPDGRRLTYVRWQEGDADLWELDLDTGATRRVTTDPYPDRSPTYAPDGTLFWTRYVSGEPFETHDRFRPGRWQLWSRAGDDPERPVPLPTGDMDVHTPAAGLAFWPEAVLGSVVVPAPTPTPGAGKRAELVELDIRVAGNHPRLHADVAAPYEAWRAEVVAQCGYDVLGQVSDMFRPLGHSSHPYGHLSWHRTGRAVDLLFEWHDLPDGPNRLLVVREDLGPQTYWRLYLHCRDQDGTMGEPLTVAPWEFWFNLDRAREPAAYAAGGKPGAVPEGYYVDLTQLAQRHGWHRIASYEEEDFDWRWDSLGREFWHYQRTDGLTWWQAMGQIYPQETLEQFYGWTVCVDELGLDPAWVEAKGIPTPTPSIAQPNVP
jgi:TolB protein